MAELFLDTPLFNAHTTGGDVLWSGIPVLTLPGENFAQRVASGLVQSAGLTRLIARNFKDYQKMAVALAKNASKRRKLKEKLIEERETLPLFDTQRLTSEFERALLMSWDIHEQYGAPFHIVVAADE
mmetsp:Transcript_34478/g.53827  ORF Transcript_34478/g.53827 Transcript_34478/m.53827 type:complete len:127 (+) Transcript_34478:531-911(+)